MFTVLAIVGAAAVSLATILISAWLPAKKAVDLPVMERLAPSNLPLDVKTKGLCFDSENPSQSTHEMGKIVTDEGVTVGIPLSLLISMLIVKIMTQDDTKFTLPWGSVGISALSVFLVIFVTMMYAVSKIKKENIIDALRDEMT